MKREKRRPEGIQNFHGHGDFGFGQVAVAQFLEKRHAGGAFCEHVVDVGGLDEVVEEPGGEFAVDGVRLRAVDEMAGGPDRLGISEPVLPHCHDRGQSDHRAAIGRNPFPLDVFERLKEIAVGLPVPRGKERREHFALARRLRERFGNGGRVADDRRHPDHVQVFENVGGFLVGTLVGRHEAHRTLHGAVDVAREPFFTQEQRFGVGHGKGRVVECGNGKIFAAADEIHVGFHLRRAFLLATVGVTAGDFDEIAAQADQNVVTDLIANVCRGFETVEKARTPTEHVRILRLRELDSESEKLDGLLRLFEVLVVAATLFFVAIGKELPAKKGLILTIHDDQVPRHAEERRRFERRRVSPQSVPDVEDHVRIEFQLRNGENDVDFLLVIGEIGKITPKVTYGFKVAVQNVLVQNRTGMTNPIVVLFLHGLLFGIAVSGGIIMARPNSLRHRGISSPAGIRRRFAAGLRSVSETRPTAAVYRPRIDRPNATPKIVAHSPRMHARGGDLRTQGRSPLSPSFSQASVATSRALMVCMRFSACSNTIERGDSKTSSVTSRPSTRFG